MYHLWWWLGPAEVFGQVNRECHNPSMRSKRIDCSSICRWSRVCPLNIFFMSFQMEDMKVRESVGGDWHQNSGSSSSSICSSEGDSTGISSGSRCSYRVEATIVCTHNSLEGHKDSVKCWKYPIWQKVFAQASDQYWMRVLHASSMLGIGNQILEYDCV